MSALDILYSLLMNLVPLLLFAIPLIFLRKKLFGLIYKRLYYGICIFFLVYWVLPSLFEFKIHEVESEENYSQGIAFILARTASLLLLFAQYPFYLLPFIFIISPIISLFLLYRRLKEESGSNMSEKLKQLSYSFDSSPREMIMESLKDPNWSREKEMFKIFGILLPISLYLLTVILDIANLEPVNIGESSTALGWFIEILFVYLATFLFSFQLIARSKITFKGRFIGDQIQSKLFSGISEVGTPIAILSVLLFIVQKTQSILLIIFFSCYFLMAAFIFIISLRIFEPISILIFIKLINWAKIRSEPKYKTDARNSGMAVIYALIAAFVNILILLIISVIMVSIQGNVPNGENFIELSLASGTPSLDIILLTDNLSILSYLGIISTVVVYGYFYSKLLKMKISPGVVFLSYGGTLLLLTILLSPFFEFRAPLLLLADQAWTTGAPIKLNVFGFDFYTMRTAFLTADFGDNWVLIILAAPFIFFRPLVTYTLFGYLFAFNDKRFRSKTISIDKDVKKVKRITFSNIDEFPSIAEFKAKAEYLITAENVVFIKKESDELMGLHEKLKNTGGLLVEEVIPLFPNETERLYTMIKYLSNKNYISWWMPEFGYNFERATLDGLYILYTDGRDLFYYNFHKDQESAVDPALVSGMFSAITSFIQETTRSVDRLASIDCGDKKVLLEYSPNVPFFAALFADRETAEIRLALKNLVAEFEKKHKTILKNWNGNMEFFKEDSPLVELCFQEFLK